VRTQLYGTDAVFEEGPRAQTVGAQVTLILVHWRSTVEIPELHGT
jgi:hypothetical protein